MLRNAGCALNYANNVRILAEPIGTRRMDNIMLLDVRVEKGFQLAGHRRVARFVDVFNVLDANPEQNTNWSSPGRPCCERSASCRRDSRGSV